MEVTLDQLQQLFPSTSGSVLDSYVKPLNDTLAAYSIDTPQRVSMFVAQIGHESGGFKFTSENLNYSAQRLLQVFPSHFHGVNANDYAHNPEKIANRIYASRMGNGDEDSGDGWSFKGRGLIQLTGRSYYTEFGDSGGKSPEEVANYLETPEGAADSAGWYWNKMNLNAPSDNEDVVTATKEINGGTLGLAERQRLYSEAITLMS